MPVIRFGQFESVRLIAKQYAIESSKSDGYIYAFSHKQNSFEFLPLPPTFTSREPPLIGPEPFVPVFPDKVKSTTFKTIRNSILLTQNSVFRVHLLLGFSLLSSSVTLGRLRLCQKFNSCLYMACGVSLERWWDILSEKNKSRDIRVSSVGYRVVQSSPRLPDFFAFLIPGWFLKILKTFRIHLFHM